MNIAVTGATGFLGRYIVNHLTTAGHHCRCWHRESSDRGGFDHPEKIQWLSGKLGDDSATQSLVDGADAVVHAALHRPGKGFRGAEGDIPQFVNNNVLGSIKLIDAAHRAAANKFIFISTCAVHEIILDDRPLDEAHPLWPASHYGAHKAAIEKFIHSYATAENFDICALRPTGIYGLARPREKTKWFNLIQHVRQGKPVTSTKGGKEVHAADVARAVEILLNASGTAGQAYNCYDMYIADIHVAQIAKQITGSDSPITAANTGPKHQIVTTKIQNLGMTFPGESRLKETVAQLCTDPTS